MKSNNYKGIDGLRELAERLGITLDKPSLVGQDWWITATLPDGDIYRGDTREVNAFVQGYEKGRQA